MSKSQAIAAVTAVLAHIVGKSSGADVDVGRPKTTDGQVNGNRKVNVYLYQVTPNAAWRNEDLPTRDGDGKVRKRPQVALDLHYLLSFYGDEAIFEPQLMMGSVMRDLHAGPLLTPAIIAKVGQDAGSQVFKDVIAASALEKSVNSVKLTMAALSLDELSKIWSIFFQTPYTISVAYQATVVLIEKDVVPIEALPVRDRGVFGVPLARPEIKRIMGKEEPANPDGVISPGATILTQGKSLQADETTVLIDGLKVVTLSVSDQEIVFTLPTKLVAEDGRDVPLRAGSHALEVVHGVFLGGLSSPEPHQIIESGPVPFLVHSTIQVTGVADKKKNGSFSAKITVQFDPAVGRAQRVWILLKETPTPADQPPRAYRFMAPKENGIPGTDEATTEITFPVKDVAPGEYLLQAHVDGGESQPVEFKEFV